MNACMEHRGKPIRGACDENLLFSAPLQAGIHDAAQTGSEQAGPASATGSFSGENFRPTASGPCRGLQISALRMHLREA